MAIGTSDGYTYESEFHFVAGHPMGDSYSMENEAIKSKVAHLDEDKHLRTIEDTVEPLPDQKSPGQYDPNVDGDSVPTSSIKGGQQFVMMKKPDYSTPSYHWEGKPTMGGGGGPGRNAAGGKQGEAVDKLNRYIQGEKVEPLTTEQLNALKRNLNSRTDYVGRVRDNVTDRETVRRLEGAIEGQKPKWTSPSMSEVHPPQPLQNALSDLAKKNMTSKEVQKVFKQHGWKIDLRRGGSDYEAFDPSGRAWYIQP